ncbi:hypothetical protein Fcan01_21003 [Folsomia candida]|uniref:Uncharacterized protein n=1 Tax=Folsomia candida TaxID=158441 RepID=A0A226DI95_FOLCA|nr:hypothetical protein Fcan01_21003 [Folsomia candida]
MKILEEKIPTIWGQGVWPGNSPDLYPINNLWSWAKEKNYVDPVPTRRDELVRRLKKCMPFVSNLNCNLGSNLSGRSFVSHCRSEYSGLGVCTPYSGGRSTRDLPEYGVLVVLGVRNMTSPRGNFPLKRYQESVYLTPEFNGVGTPPEEGLSS